MKFGVREICDVVFRAKAPMQVGKKIFYKGEPVMYFDTLKTSTLEGAATTVYAQGGRGNARLMSWDGERTVTFTMEDALISPEGLAILTGAGLIEAGTGDGEAIQVHVAQRITLKDGMYDLDNGQVSFTDIELDEPVSEHTAAGVYVMLLDADDNLVMEPFSSLTPDTGAKVSVVGGSDGKKLATAQSTTVAALQNLTSLAGYKLLVDYYTDKTSGTMQINITPDKFGGAFYIEASTLFREYPSQRDLPAEFIIPNGRVQSNFTFTMAGSGDPSTFTFTVDAFPDYTRFNNTEKVLAAIQVIGGSDTKGTITTRETTNTSRQFINGDLKEMNTDESGNPESVEYKPSF